MKNKIIAANCLLLINQTKICYSIKNQIRSFKLLIDRNRINISFVNSEFIRMTHTCQNSFSLLSSSNGTFRFMYLKMAKSLKLQTFNLIPSSKKNNKSTLRHLMQTNSCLTLIFLRWNTIETTLWDLATSTFNLYLCTWTCKIGI